MKTNLHDRWHNFTFHHFCSYNLNTWKMSTKNFVSKSILTLSVINNFALFTFIVLRSNALRFFNSINFKFILIKFKKTKSWSRLSYSWIIFCAKCRVAISSELDAFMLQSNFWNDENWFHCIHERIIERIVENKKEDD